MQIVKCGVGLLAYLLWISDASAVSNKAYATVGMLSNNATLCTKENKKCGLFVSMANMNAIGVRTDGGVSGGDAIETAKIICAEEGALIDGGKHLWLPWISSDNIDAKTLTNLDTSGAKYFRVGTSIFVLDALSLSITGEHKLGASVDGTDSEFWTGTRSNGTVYTGENCNNWTTTSSSGYGTIGYRYSVDYSWSQSGTVCSYVYPVLCLEQIG